MSEHRRGQEEGVKDRPCAVVMAVTEVSGDRIVTVVPITHTPPSDPAVAVEIPYVTKRRLGLDDDASWVSVAEANRFRWPGPDLRLGPSGDTPSMVFGLLPRGLFNSVREKLARVIQEQSIHIVTRTQ